MPLEAGRQLGPYEIVSAIGAGGMGEVYKARDTRLDRTVAIKVLPEHVASDPDLKQRFEREAKTISSLNHPHICTLYDIGSQDGIDFLVMEYLEGDTLAQRLEKGALPLDQALTVAIEIADALDKAHRQGITHRDLKPGNIMITKAGTKLLDFGLAKLKQPGVGAGGMSAVPTLSAGLTMQGTILGTLQYMAPEQLEGTEADARTDIFAFGAVLYEMATGRKAFEGKSQASLISAIMTSDPPTIASLQPMSPPLLDQIVKTCLAKDPDDRWQGAGDLGRQLKIIQGGSQRAVAAPATFTPQPGSWRQGIPLALGTLVVGSVITGVAVWSVMRPAPPAPQTPVRFVVSIPNAPLLPSGTHRDVAVSPDGTRIVYRSSTGGAGLKVRTLDQLTPTTLVAEGNPHHPFFSPDGERLAFQAAGRVLQRVSVHGGPTVEICALPGVLRGASWGADDTIIFATGAADSGLWRVPSGGGEPEQLTTPDERGNHWWPEILPSGEAVLFTMMPAAVENAQLAVLSLADGEPKILNLGGSHPRYIPTGHLVYGVDGTLRAVRFNLDRLAVTSDPIPVVDGVNTKRSGAANFSFSDQGSLVYVSGASLSNDRTLALVGRNGVVEPLSVPPAQYLTPRLSPDGGKLVVQTVEDEGNVLWIYDLSEDTQIQQLTFEGDNHRPVWTPDSQRITFSSDRDGTMSLYWMPADGSGAPERLTTAEEGTSHWAGSWSPDGETLLFNVQRELATDWDIWTLSIDDRETQSLHDTPETIYMGAELSPDGQWLAYGAGPRSTAVDIYVEPFPPTGSRRRISQNGGYWPLWSPDGDRLFYRPAASSAGITLRSVDIVTEPAFAFSNEQTLPIEGFNVVSYYRDYDITPDGERLVMVFPADQTEGGESSRPQITVVLNWFDELQRLVPTP